MSTPSLRKPKFVSAEGQQYVRVRSGRAAALVMYLRSHGVRVGHPEPCDSQTETVPLVGRADPAAVQELLRAWA